MASATSPVMAAGGVPMEAGAGGQQRSIAVDAALLGGALTGAGLGAVQCWAARGALGRAVAWIGASAIGYAVGLAAGAALVGYDTDLGSLAVMGLLSGAALGGAQGLVLAREGRRGLALPWALAMPVLFALGWCESAGIGVDVADQFTVFGAAGAVMFTLLSGLVLARFTPALEKADVEPLRRRPNRRLRPAATSRWRNERGPQTP